MNEQSTFLPPGKTKSLCAPSQPLFSWGAEEELHLVLSGTYTLTEDFRLSYFLRNFLCISFFSFLAYSFFYLLYNFYFLISFSLPFRFHTSFFNSYLPSFTYNFLSSLLPFYFLPHFYLSVDFILFSCHSFWLPFYFLTFLFYFLYNVNSLNVFISIYYTEALQNSLWKSDIRISPFKLFKFCRTV